MDGHEGVTKATNLVMAATDKGVQQMEKHMGMLTRKQINALCERLDDDEDGALSRFEIVKIGSVLQVALTDEDMQHMLRELRLDTGEVEAVDFEVVGQWLNNNPIRIHKQKGILIPNESAMGRRLCTPGANLHRNHQRANPKQTLVLHD